MLGLLFMSISLVLIFYEDLMDAYFNFRFPQNDNSAHNSMLNG